MVFDRIRSRTPSSALTPEQARDKIEAGVPVETADVQAGANETAFSDLILSSAAWLQGHQQTAETFAERAISKNPDLVVSNWVIQNVLPRLSVDSRFGHPWFDLQISAAGFRSKNFDKAIRAAQEGLKKAATSPVCGYRLLEFLVESELFDKSLTQPGIADNLRRQLAEASGVPDASLDLYRGVLAHHSGKRREAAKLFARFSAAGLPLSHFSLGAHSYIEPFSDGHQSVGSVDLLKKAEGDGPVYLFTADKRYFHQWNEIVRSSWAVHSRDTRIHFHVVGGRSTLNELAGDIPEHVGLSTEPDHAAGAAYYASARFVRAAEFLALYRSGLVLCDIDSRFTCSDQAMISEFGSKEAVLKVKNTDCHMPWRSVTADLVYIGYNETGEKISKSVGDYLRAVFSMQQNESLWWCDQNALAYAYEISKSRVTSFYDIRAKVGRVPIEFAPNHSAKKEAFIRAARAELKL